MRITGGAAKSTALIAPKSDKTRPATDQMRAAVFSSLAHLGALEGARVLDLFAGTGAYGLEALSRGARQAVFVEKDPSVMALLKANAQKVLKSFKGSSDQISLQMRDAAAIEFPVNSFDLIFADPPYPLWSTGPWLGAALGRVPHFLIPGGLLVFELPAQLDLPAAQGVEFIKRLGKKGSNAPSVIIGRKLISFFIDPTE